MRSKFACSSALRLSALLLFSGCATNLPPSLTHPVEPPQRPEIPAALKTSESQEVQDYSQRVSAWLQRVEAFLNGSTPK